MSLSDLFKPKVLAGAALATFMTVAAPSDADASCGGRHRCYSGGGYGFNGGHWNAPRHHNYGGGWGHGGWRWVPPVVVVPAVPRAPVCGWWQYPYQQPFYACL